MASSSGISSFHGRIWHAQLMLRKSFGFIAVLNTVPIFFISSILFISGGGIFDFDFRNYLNLMKFVRSVYADGFVYYLYVLDFIGYVTVYVIFSVVVFDIIFILFSALLYFLSILLGGFRVEELYFCEKNVGLSFVSTIVCLLSVLFLNDFLFRVLGFLG
jgi:hypothetical protein